MSRKGILLTNAYGLDIRNGHLFVSDCSRQDQVMAILSQPGEWKEAPAVGVGIESWLNDDNPGDLALEVKIQLKSIGQTVNSVTYSNDQLLLDAGYD